MKEYDVILNGVETRIQMSDEAAEIYGLTDSGEVETKQKRPRNKARSEVSDK